jgi:hypothetical protein
MLGREIGRVDHFAGLPPGAASPALPYSGTADKDRPTTPALTLAQNSPVQVAHLSQSRLMPHLLAAAKEAGSTVRLNPGADGARRVAGDSIRSVMIPSRS